MASDQVRHLLGQLRKAGRAHFPAGANWQRGSKFIHAARATIREMSGDQRAASPAEGVRTVVVWDLPTRLFKWLLVLFVSVGFLVSSMHPRGLFFLVHVGCGYAVVLLLLFRLGWGFIGGEQARFAVFVRRWRTVAAHGKALLRLRPVAAAGHNPLGGWMILLMLATLAGTALTGLLTEGSSGGGGVLSGLLSPGMDEAVGWIHGTLGVAIIWLAAFHVGGVLVESLLHRENLVRTMITGRRRVRSPALKDARAVSLWRAVPIVLLLALLGVWMIGGTVTPPPGGTPGPAFGFSGSGR